MFVKLFTIFLLVFSRTLLADCWYCYDLYEAIVTTKDKNEYAGVLSLNDGQKELYEKAKTNNTSLDKLFESMPWGHITLRSNLDVISKNELGLTGNLSGYYRYYIVRDARNDIILQTGDIKEINIIRKMNYPEPGSDALEISYSDDNHPFNTGAVPTQAITLDSDVDYTVFYFINFGSPHKDLNNKIMKILGVKNKEQLLSKFSYESNANTTRILYENNILVITEGGD